MKKIIILLVVALVVIVCMSGCKQYKAGRAIKNGKFDTIAPVKIEKPAPIYHIKIKNYYDNDFEIVYTNDDWVSEKPIMITFDLASSKDLNVCYQEWLNASCEECTQFAKQFRTYQEAEKYNAHVYQQYQELLKYRKAHPLPSDDEQEAAKPIPQCPTSNIY